MSKHQSVGTWALPALEQGRNRPAPGCEHRCTGLEDAHRPPVGRGDVGLLAQFPYDAALFSVRGSAYFHDFGKFLADFENEFPYFRVQNISLTAGSEGAVGTEEKLFFKMDVVALIKPNP